MVNPDYISSKIAELAKITGKMTPDADPVQSIVNLSVFISDIYTTGFKTGFNDCKKMYKEVGQYN